MTCCVDKGGVTPTSAPICRNPGKSASMLIEVIEVKRA